MINRICSMPTLLKLVLGAAAGYGAAVVEWRSPAKAAVEKRTDVIPQIEEANLPADAERGCSSALTRSDQVALAGHNQLVAASLAQSGKKPNICIIWGDD